MLSPESVFLLKTNHKYLHCESIKKQKLKKPKNKIMKKQNKTKTIVMLMVFSVMFWINGYGQVDYTWTGASIDISGLWTDPDNWSSSIPGTIPSSIDNVIFDGIGGNECVINTDINIHSIYISAAYLLQITIPADVNVYLSGNLTIEDNLFSAVWSNTGTIILNGTLDQTITIESPDLWRFNNLTINNTSAVVYINSDIWVDGVYYKASGVDLQGTGTINGNPLPIELLSFDAVATTNSITIFWSTASEENNDYFVIEKSKDCSLWNEIDRIDGAGNSQRIIHYSTADTDPWIGISYYRLTQVDYDGNYETFGPIALGFYATNLLVYPNPAQNIINLPDCAKIFDQQGRMILIGKPGENDISKLPKGLYHVMIHNISQTFIKQ